MSTTAPAPALILNGERQFSFTAIAVKLPGYRGNASINSSTLYRWATKGLRAANGQLVRLEAVRFGASWKTSLEAVARFSAKLTAAAIPPDDTSAPAGSPEPAPRTPSARAASKELAEALGAK